MERDNPVNDDIVFDGNFNSHAHVERDPVTIVIHFLIKISTHTLTWSVTVILAVLSDI